MNNVLRMGGLIVGAGGHHNGYEYDGESTREHEACFAAQWV